MYHFDRKKNLCVLVSQKVEKTKQKKEYEDFSNVYIKTYVL